MPDPHVYTDEEIELFLRGDRREIDRLLLSSTNAVVAELIRFRDEEFRPHAHEEQKMKDALGSPDEVLQRRLWLDLQIKKEMDRAKLRKRLLEGSLLWVLPIVLAATIVIFGEGLRARLVEWLVTPTQQDSPHHGKDKK